MRNQEGREAAEQMMSRKEYLRKSPRHGLPRHWGCSGTLATGGARVDPTTGLRYLL